MINLTGLGERLNMVFYSLRSVLIQNESTLTKSQVLGFLRKSIRQILCIPAMYSGAHAVRATVCSDPLLNQAKRSVLSDNAPSQQKKLLYSLAADKAPSVESIDY